MEGEPVPAERRPVLLELARDECFELLASVPIGRVATTPPPDDQLAAPIVEPVAFIVDGETIVFRTQAGTKLVGLNRGTASFEADSFDQSHHTGWSVLVRGTAYEAPAEEVAQLDLTPWVPGPRDVWIRILPEVVTGRRLVTAGGGIDWRGYL